MVLVDTGLKTPMTFFKHELALPENKQQAKLKFGIQAVEEYDEPKLLMPKILEKKIRRKQIWTELHNIWQNKGMVEGTILNNVKGGFAVGLGGFVAFMPRSLRRGKKLKKTTFRILTMKEANLNIVLREVQTEKKLMTWSKLFSMRKNAQPVEGFVLQRISDGYLVRIAGHDAFLPHAYRRSRRLETKFHIVSMNARNMKIIVREAGGITPSSLFQAP
ncbi:hypothetical protein O6H91_06G019300 [Diphasiastrum complanatum]|nr:hypothetical protein O6H91_06G019300 [Diphasiastrum complanatum]